MRHQLKARTPSAAARLSYITREGRYAVGLDGPRNDLRAVGSANLPGWTGGDAAAFWAAADGYERANARRCLELELNLPRELNTRQQVAAVEDYIARLSAEAGPMPCTWAIHNAGDGNPHVHLMIQERPLDGHERTAETWFKRANRAAPEKGGAIKSTWWHDRENVFWSRALWADACNQSLIQGGHEARFDARSKAARFDESLRAGDLRAAALLTTVTERHEGHAVAGMRRRYDNHEVELDDLPDYAQQLIQHNDRARAHNNGLRDWVRSASDAELREYLAAPLAELRERLESESPSAHVAAWEAAQHVQALDEDRVRSVATAQQAGELELLAGAQIEAAERAAIAGELAALIEREQGGHLGDLLAIEREQAHSAALIEHQERERLRADAELRTARAELQAAQREAERLRTAIAAPKPACMSAALELRDRCREAAARAERWQRENPVKSLLGKLIEPAPVREARELEEAYMASPERAQALQWQADREQRKAQLAEVRERLPALEQAAKHAELRALELMPRDELLRLRDDTAKRLAERLERAGGKTAELYGERVQRARQTAARTTEPARVAELIQLMRSFAVEIEPHARAVDRREVTELVRDALEDLRLATATLSDRGATQAQRERLYALCDATRDLRNPLERAQRDGPLPALGDARAMREQARELRDQGEALTDAIRKQREIAKAMRGPRNGPRL